MKTVNAISSIIFAAALGAFVVSGCSAKGNSASDASSPRDSAGAARQAGSGDQKAGGQSGGNAWGGAGGTSSRRQSIVPVQASSVTVGLLSVDRSTTGVISPVTQSQVVAQVAGVVQSVPRLVGDWVKSGELVMQLDDAQLKLTLASAESSLSSAKINLEIGNDNARDASPKLSLQVQSAQSALDSAKKYYDSQKALYDLGGISASQLDTAASQLALAQANLEGAKSSLSQNDKAGEQTIAQLRLAVTSAENQVAQARLNLQNAAIRAPFAGQIAAINLQPGMYASLNTAAFTLVSADRHVSFSIPPSDAVNLGLGTPIVFSFQGKNYPARISQSLSAPIAGVVPSIASSRDVSSLPFGSIGSVTYRVPLATGAQVPLAALQTLENQNYVFVIDNNRVAVKNVTIIAEAGTTAVVDGLSADDVVIVSPPPD